MADEAKTTDLRSVRTGTLIFNLILASTVEQQMTMQVHQLARIKDQQNLVGDTPQAKQLMEQLQKVQVERYKLANEVNARFADHDARRAAQFDLEIDEQLVEVNEDPGEQV